MWLLEKATFPSIELSEEPKQEREKPSQTKRSTETIGPLTLRYDEYLQTPLWRGVILDLIEESTSPGASIDQT
jgi:hypothetical protein